MAWKDPVLGFLFFNGGGVCGGSCRDSLPPLAPVIPLIFYFSAYIRMCFDRVCLFVV